MLLQTPAPGGPRWPNRATFGAASGLLTLAVFVAGASLVAPVSGQQEDTKKTESKKEKPSQDETKKDDLKKKEADKDDTKKDDPKKREGDKDDTKKTEDDKEIDELVKEMTRNIPAADAATLKRIREQVQNYPPEQRKNMLRMMRNRNQLGGPRQPPGGVMAPGFGWPGRDARLGVRVDPPSDDLAEQLDLPKGKGLVVREVVPESAAAKAGIKPHDILVELDGKAVSNRYDELARMVAAIKPDTAVEVVVVRKGKKETIKEVKLPEVKAAPGFPLGGFPGGAGQPPAGISQPPFAFQQSMGIGGASVITTMTRTHDRFTLRHQEGTLVITLLGQTADGKPKIKEIHIQDGGRLEQHESVDKVPERYRDKVQNLIEMSEKGSVRIDIKSP